MAIGYGVACPKGPTRKKLKARKDREDAKALKAFRDAVWERETLKYCEYVGTLWIPSSFQVAFCQHCGRQVKRGREWPMTAEVHHRIFRGNKATRYDPANGVLLCNHLVNNCHEKAERKLINV